MSSYVSMRLRRLVAERADFLCEYCLIHAEDTFFGCEVDHVIGEKHGGATEAENLAYACTFCNRCKGSDIGSVTSSGAFMRFFNPRTDRWANHFALEDVQITPLTPIEEVTANILRLNMVDRLLERKALCEVKRYPSASARSRIVP